MGLISPIRGIVNSRCGVQGAERPPYEYHWSWGFRRWVLWRSQVWLSRLLRR
jgi:hypothetical protein